MFTLVLLTSLAVGQQPEAKEKELPEPTILCRAKPELLSKADFEKAKELVLKLPEIRAQIEKYGKDYNGEAHITNPQKEPNSVRFFFKVGQMFLAQTVTVDTKEWKATYKAHQDPTDARMAELEKLKEKLKKKEKD